LDTIKIEDIQALCNARKIIWSSHCAQRLIKRNIPKADVKNALLNGEIIEQYPTDYPYPSCLVLGLTLKQLYLHVVGAIGNESLFMITAYYPNRDKWMPDFKTRKEQKQ